MSDEKVGIIADMEDGPERQRLLKSIAAHQIAAIDVGKELAALRIRRNVSRSTLARVLGSHATQIWRVESGRATNTGVHFLVKMATALGGSIRISVAADP